MNATQSVVVSHRRGFLHVSRRRFLCAAINLLVLSVALGPAISLAAFPEYKDQDSKNTFLHSAIMTSTAAQRVQFDNMGMPVLRWMPAIPIYDTDFAKLVSGAIAPRISEIAYDFNECNGGGMIDELKIEAPQPVASYTSAARHDQIAWASSLDTASGIDPLFPIVRRVESLYNLRYAPEAGGAAPKTQKDAAKIGYDNDFYGPNFNPTFENPQFTSNGAAGDSITLHKKNPNNPVQNDKYLAILFGGSTTVDPGFAMPSVPPFPPALPIPIGGFIGVNWNTLNRIHDSLIADGYAEDDIYVMYPSLINPANGNRIRLLPDGNAVPAWVDADSEAADLKFAFNNWLKPKVTPQTQVYYWSSWGHGTEQFDWWGWLKSKAGAFFNRQAVNLETDKDFTNRLASAFNFFNPGGTEGAQGTPLIEVATTQSLPDLQLFLNGDPDPLTLHGVSDVYGDGSEYRHYFALTRDDLNALLANCGPTVCTVNLEVDVPFLGNGVDLSNMIIQMGPQLGDFANSIATLSIPEPTSATLALIGLLASALIGRRARRQ